MNWGKIWDLIQPLNDFILIQISQSNLVFAHAIKQKSQFHIYDSITYPLTNIDFSEQRINNPTKIHTLLANFAHNLRIKKPSLIICAPFLDPKNPFALIQLLLCFSKNGFTIKHIYTTPHPLIPLQKHHKSDSCPHQQTLYNNSLIDYLIPHGYHLTSKIILSLLSLSACFGVLAISILATTKQQIKNYQSLVITQDKEVKRLHTKVKEIHELKNKNTETTNKISSLKNVTSHNNNPLELLVSLSKNMPPNSKLTDLKIGRTKTIRQKQKPTQYSTLKTHTPKIPLLLQGITHNPEEIGSFMQTLSEVFPNAHFSLAYIKKYKHQKTTTSVSYKFSIEGFMSAKDIAKNSNNA
jgi:Tfp pilus assembly protein PilN